MFQASLNRLAGFLEISALSIAQAQSGGAQLKAGYLRISSSGNQGAGFGAKAVSRKSKRAQKWCAVRDSYLVVVDELAEVCVCLSRISRNYFSHSDHKLTVYDVFLIDSQFKIERPARYYRQLLHPGSPDPHSDIDEKGKGKGKESSGNTRTKEGLFMSTLGSVRNLVPDVFKRPFMRHSSMDHSLEPLEAKHFDSCSDLASPDQYPTSMLDPSTNTDPLLDHDERDVKDALGKPTRRDGGASKHTFYIQNAQMRLKLYAKNEVCGYRRQLWYMSDLYPPASNVAVDYCAR
jgi:phospholipase D1/2